MPKVPRLSRSLLFVSLLLGSVQAGQAQPFLVKDIRTGELPAQWPADPQFVDLGGVALFTAFDGNHGTELWRSDGTPGGTSLVRDVCPGICSSSIGELTVVGEDIYFRADDGAHGPALWRSDGTQSGTVLVKEVVPFRLADIDGALVAFMVVSLDQGAEPWRSDGTAAGTFSLGDLQPGALGSSPYPLESTGSLLLFWADDGSHGAELWKTDGTVAGTGLVEDLNPGASGAMPGGAYASAALGDRILFWGYDGSAPVSRLWVSDGTPAGTARLGTVTGPGSFPSGTLGGSVFFRASDPGQGAGLWKSDGTEDGTVLVKEMTTWFYEPTVAGDRVFFQLEGGFSITTELWSSDGTEAGTGPVPLPPGVAIRNDASAPCSRSAMGSSSMPIRATAWSPGRPTAPKPGPSSSLTSIPAAAGPTPTGAASPSAVSRSSAPSLRTAWSSGRATARPRALSSSRGSTSPTTPASTRKSKPSARSTPPCLSKQTWRALCSSPPTTAPPGKGYGGATAPRPERC
jgi:ELWxxDGT repeat protein